MTKQLKLIKLATIDSIENSFIKSRLLQVIHQEAPWIDESDELLYGISYNGTLYAIWVSRSMRVPHLRDYVGYKDKVAFKQSEIWIHSDIEFQYPSYFNALLPIESEIFAVTCYFTKDEINKLFDQTLGNNYERIIEDRIRMIR